MTVGSQSAPSGASTEAVQLAHVHKHYTMNFVSPFRLSGLRACAQKRQTRRAVCCCVQDVGRANGSAQLKRALSSGQNLSHPLIPDVLKSVQGHETWHCRCSASGGNDQCALSSRTVTLLAWRRCERYFDTVAFPCLRTSPASQRIGKHGRR